MIKLDLEGWHAKFRNHDTGKSETKPIVFAIFAMVPTQQGMATSVIPFVDNEGTLTAVQNGTIVRVPDA